MEVAILVAKIWLLVVGFILGFGWLMNQDRFLVFATGFPTLVAVVVFLAYHIAKNEAYK